MRRSCLLSVRRRLGSSNVGEGKGSLASTVISSVKWKLDKPEEVWRACLSFKRFHSLRQRRQDPPFSPIDGEQKAVEEAERKVSEGSSGHFLYRCAGCSQLLFSSENRKRMKEHGWPVFDKSIDQDLDLLLPKTEAEGMKTALYLSVVDQRQLSKVAEPKDTPSGTWKKRKTLDLSQWSKAPAERPIDDPRIDTGNPIEWNVTRKEKYQFRMLRRERPYGSSSPDSLIVCCTRCDGYVGLLAEEGESTRIVVNPSSVECEFQTC